MIHEILFVLSMTIVIHFLIITVAAWKGEGVSLGVPFLHLKGISYGNCYISTPAIAYQIYFWANYFSII